MRVIAGEAKGHKLVTLKGDTTRPTMDKVKGAIFNMIAPYMYDASVLDLFAGSGALGIEALSRGAKNAVFVDKSRSSVDIIKKNLNHTKLIDKATILNGDVVEIVSRAELGNPHFDIIFMDPPYNKKFAQKVLIFLESNGILKDSGIIIVEHSKDDELPMQIGRLRMTRSKQYGITIISFYQYIKEEE
ncbi:MAG: 16S rRNA (guanine(966)-N(2))-methyltransferase RsmD [Clostridiales bacterium]|nr:16S rRNA (guanine(966)-N(2))-methyltransferase RsmD [Clostridiales bacterium]